MKPLTYLGNTNLSSVVFALKGLDELFGDLDGLEIDQVYNKITFKVADTLDGRVMMALIAVLNAEVDGVDDFVFSHSPKGWGSTEMGYTALYHGCKVSSHTYEADVQSVMIHRVVMSYEKVEIKVPRPA